MKRIKNFIPLNKNNRNIFINDVIDAFISYFIGNVVEAFFDFEIIKMIISIIFYIIFFIIRNCYQKVKNKDIFKNRGIKEIKKINIKIFLERGIIIIGIVLFNKINIIFLIMHLTWREYNMQKFNLINYSYKSCL